MAKKLGTLKTKRLFLGTDNGGRGTEVTSSAAELNQLGEGSITADITADVVDTTRLLVDGIDLQPVTYSADGNMSSTVSFVKLNGTTATCDLTLGAPTEGLLLVVTCVDASNSCTLTLTAGDFDGSNEIATFDAAEETLVLFGISSTRYVIVENIGAVVFSSAA